MPNDGMQMHPIIPFIDPPVHFIRAVASVEDLFPDERLSSPFPMCL
jgi:hypothetical protein